MRLINFIPSGTKVDFMALRKIAAVASGAAAVLSVALYLVVGLNFGIDFRGGILIEVRNQTGPANIGQMRGELGRLGLGEVQLQEFGDPSDVLIRIEQLSDAEARPFCESAAAKAAFTDLTKVDPQTCVTAVVKGALGSGFEYRRIEFVGPKVGSELIEAGITAVLLAMAAMLIYIWFRFEWQFGVGAVVALAHDVTLTIGIFSLLGLEFNLSTVAAILTIAGYSINDTVVVYDRVRENLRKYKRMPLVELLNLSINETLSRTLLTSFTTLLALLALFFVGGPVVKGFSFAMIWGVVVGTYSSIFIAVPLLINMKLSRAGLIVGEGEETGQPAPGE